MWDFITEPEFQEKLDWKAFIAGSWIELRQYRLLVRNTAWAIDTQPHGAAPWARPTRHPPQACG